MRLPGSPEKKAALIARTAAGQSLWHPNDAILEPASVEALGFHESHVEGTMEYDNVRWIALPLSSILEFAFGGTVRE